MNKHLLRQVNMLSKLIVAWSFIKSRLLLKRGLYLISILIFYWVIHVYSSFLFFCWSFAISRLTLTYLLNRDKIIKPYSSSRQNGSNWDDETFSSHFTVFLWFYIFFFCYCCFYISGITRASLRPQLLAAVTGCYRRGFKTEDGAV